MNYNPAINKVIYYAWKPQSYDQPPDKYAILIQLVIWHLKWSKTKLNIVVVFWKAPGALDKSTRRKS